MSENDKPKYSLTSVQEFTEQDIVEMFENLIGRKITDEELEELRQEMASEDADFAQNETKGGFPYRTKAVGEPCKPGERADLTNCIPVQKPVPSQVKPSPLATGRGVTKPPNLPEKESAQQAQQTQPTNEPKAETAKTNDYGFSEADVTKFHELKKEWAACNIALKNYIDNPASPEAKKLIDKQRDVIKQMQRLHASHGRWEDIGLPGAERDVVIIGAGPGGLQAAISAGYEGLNGLLIEASEVPGGQAKYTGRIQNYGSWPIGISGPKLTGQMYEQAVLSGTEAKLGIKVVGLSVDAKTGMKKVKLSNGEEIETRSVIIAGGMEFRKIKFPGSDSNHVVVGNGKKLKEISRGKPVVLLGGSNGAAQAALEVADTASMVYVLARRQITSTMSENQVTSIKNHPKIQIIEGDEITAFVNDHDVKTKTGRDIPAEYVGVFVGQAPNTSWLPKEVEKDSKRRIVVDADLQTKMPGVYAVGDIRQGGMGRIMGATGDGSFAVKNLFPYFKRVLASNNKSLFNAKTKDFNMAKQFSLEEWEKLIDLLAEYDKENPYLDQMVEPDEPDQPAETTSEDIDEATA